MDYGQIAIIAGFACVYAAAAGRLEHSIFGGALAFTAFGLAFGPSGAGLIEIAVTAEALRVIAEMTLALVLFVDASKADLRVLASSFQIPQRLILLSLPLTILLGIGIGVLVFDQLALLEIAILATLLAPTDAALGKSVVTNERVPPRIREGLNFESGLNDGVCVPIFLALLTFAVAESADQSLAGLALELVVLEIGIGAAVGAALSFVADRMLKFCDARGWLTEDWGQVPVVALAVACFATAQVLHGSGFIAAFVGGLMFGHLAGRHTRHLILAAEETGDVLALLTWVIFGAAVVGQSADAFTWQVVLYAVLSLTVIRMLPVFLTLNVLGLRTGEKLFIGWFGPRGLATIVFGVMVLNSGIPGAETIAATAVCTILLSVVAHGLSALPLIDWLARAEPGSDSSVPPGTSSPRER